VNLSKSYEVFQPEKNNDRIHIIGCGSVGSSIAEMLARSGVENMTLWDFDVVESKNIANQMFYNCDIGMPKIEALANIIKDINPNAEDNIEFEKDGWDGQQLSGYVFLCVDSIEIRKKIVEKHYDSPFIKAMFDVRTRLEDAQHYAADWSDSDMKKAFLNSMNFTHEEAEEETPVSACGTTLGVCHTVRAICAFCVANFINFWNDKGIKKLILVDAFRFTIDAF